MCRGVGAGPLGELGGGSLGRRVGDALPGGVPGGVSFSRSTSCLAGDASGLAAGGSFSCSGGAGPSQVVAAGGGPPGLLAAAANTMLWERLRPGDEGGDSDNARASCASSAAVAAASEWAARVGPSFNAPSRSSSRSRIVLAPACAWNFAKEKESDRQRPDGLLLLLEVRSTRWTIATRASAYRFEFIALCFQSLLQAQNLIEKDKKCALCQPTQICARYI